MKLTNKFRLVVIVSCIFLTLLFLMLYTGRVFGNSSYFGPAAASSTASSTPQFLTAGATAATSTPVVYDSYGINGTNQTPGQKTDATDSASLLMYVQATSTATVYRLNIEYSDGIDATGTAVDCKTTPTKCDWYENNLETYAAGVIALATPNTYTWTYASTTFDGGMVAIANQNKGTRIIRVDIPTRYARAFVSVAGANGSVYLKWIPKKQQQQ